MGACGAFRYHHCGTFSFSVYAIVLPSFCHRFSFRAFFACFWRVLGVFWCECLFCNRWLWLSTDHAAYFPLHRLARLSSQPGVLSRACLCGCPEDAQRTEGAHTGAAGTLDGSPGWDIMPGGGGGVLPAAKLRPCEEQETHAAAGPPKQGAEGAQRQGGQRRGTGTSKAGRSRTVRRTGSDRHAGTPSAKLPFSFLLFSWLLFSGPAIGWPLADKIDTVLSRGPPGGQAGGAVDPAQRVDRHAGDAQRPIVTGTSPIFDGGQGARGRAARG